MNDYDLIVIGAGISGLIAANVVQKEGKKVLVLEKNNIFSKESNSLIKGRFAFNPSLSEVGYYNSENDVVDNILKNIGIKKIKYIKTNEAFRLVSKDEYGHRLDYVLPFGIDNFIEKMEEYVPDSKECMESYFKLAEECNNALKYILGTHGEPNEEIMKSKYENFMKVSTYSHSEVLDMLGVPLHAQEILNTYWINFGSSETEISFVQYASQMYEYIKNGIHVLRNGNYELLYALLNEFTRKGGDVRFNSCVKNLIVDNGCVRGVTLLNDTNIASKHVLFNGSLHELYGKLIEKKDLPIRAVQRCNQKRLGLRRFTVQLGLNRTIDELGIHNYSYYIYDTLDSDLELTKMNSLSVDSAYCRCLNVIDNGVSPDGTTLLELNTYFSGSVFEEEITDANYEKIKNKVANSLIKLFEDKMKLKIKPYIEEINVLTPADYYLMNGNYVDGYKLISFDNMLYRYFNIKNERYIKGLYNCGSFGIFGSTMDGLFMSGEIAGELTIMDMAGE